MDGNSSDVRLRLSVRRYLYYLFVWYIIPTAIWFFVMSSIPPVLNPLPHNVKIDPTGSVRRYSSL